MIKRRIEGLNGYSCGLAQYDYDGFYNALNFLRLSSTKGTISKK